MYEYESYVNHSITIESTPLSTLSTLSDALILYASLALWLMQRHYQRRDESVNINVRLCITCQSSNHNRVNPSLSTLSVRFPFPAGLEAMP